MSSDFSALPLKVVSITYKEINRIANFKIVGFERHSWLGKIQ